LTITDHWLMQAFPAQALLKWFSAEQRPLPWREAYNPYEVWVSEIMLQQTRVEQMLPYYERFLQKFPSVEALAQADEQAVLKAWEGLGYYSRARNFHAAAKRVVERFGGKLPMRLDDLLELPGLGPYTAAAVASIAFNKNHAVVDGNVVRVLSRFFARAGEAKDFQETAQQILPKGRARAFNQALMELGALVCVPQQPLCGQCPLNGECVARKQGMQEEFPERATKKRRPTKVFAAACVREPLLGAGSRDGLWLVKGENKLLGGLWGFPLVPFKPLADAKETLEKRFDREFGVQLTLHKELGRAEHDYTHFHQVIVLFEASAEGRKLVLASEKELARLPLSKVNQKLLKLSGAAISRRS